MDDIEKLIGQMSDEEKQNFECEQTKVVFSLIDELVTQPLPDDFEIWDASYNKIIASIRHEYTNYEDLLSRLPKQGHPIESGQPYCLCPSTWESGEECLNAEIAHTQLKRAAKVLAEGIYKDWFEAKKG